MSDIIITSYTGLDFKLFFWTGYFSKEAPLFIFIINSRHREVDIAVY